MVLWIYIHQNYEQPILKQNKGFGWTEAYYLVSTFRVDSGIGFSLPKQPYCVFTLFPQA